MTIRQLILSRPARSNQNAALLGVNGFSLTGAQLSAEVDALTADLANFGIGRNDRVAIVLPNGPEMAISFLAVASIATAAPLNPGYRAPEFDFYLGDLNAKAIIVGEREDGAAVAVAQSRGIPVIRATSRNARGMRFETTDHINGAPRRSEGAQSGDVALVLHTSGTTARPKIVPLSQENLCASAENISRWLNLTPADTCLNVMPLFHIHGLIAALLSSLAAGAAVVCTDGFNASKVLPWLGEFRPSWYTAVPTMHQAILARAEADEISRTLAPRLRFIRSSSAALPPSVAEGLERTFGVPVIEAYGMTEASHQMCCNPLPPAPRKFGSVGLPAGPEVAVMNAVGELRPAGETGEIVIRGRNVTAGYESNPQANASSFTNGWFRTGDLGHVDADGYVFLSGRSKEIINRGGEKISPREIDEALLGHGAVAAAVAFAVPDPKLGEEIAAAVVLKAGQSATAYEIMSFAALKLADFKVPRRVLILDEIPKGPTGKVQRVGLAAKLGLSSVHAGNGDATEKKHIDPQTECEKRVAAIWRDVLGAKDPGTQDNFFELGGDSMLAAQVIARVRAAGLGDLRILVFFEHPTLAAMAKAIDAQHVSSDASANNEDPAEFERLLAEVENLTDAEAEALLRQEAAAEAAVKAARARE